MKSRPFLLNAKLITAEDGMSIGDNFKTLTNMRYANSHPKGISGMTKINTTALSTHPKIRSAFHFKKYTPEETHVLVQSYNSGSIESKVYRNDTAIPSSGDFNGTALHTDASGAGTGYFSSSPGGHAIYCNGMEAMIWGGDECSIGKFLMYNPSTEYKLDYTDKVLNTFSDSDNVASFLLVSGGLDADAILLMHFENNVTDSSTTPHTVTNNGCTFTTSAKFGTYGASFDGTNDYMTIPDHADFNFSDGTWSIDEWINVTDYSATRPLYYQKLDVKTLAFTAGGTTPIVAGNTITGGTSGATAIVGEVVVTSGSWAGSDAAGTLYLINQTGSFQAETITPGPATIAGNSSDSGNNNYIYAYINTSGYLCFVIHEHYASGSDVVSLQSNIGITVGSYFHYEITESGNNYYVFINGVIQDYASSTSRPANYESTVFLGNDNSTAWYKGSRDELRVSQVARHTANFTPNSVAYSSSTTSGTFLVGSKLPINKVKIYISVANASTSTLTGQYWNGSTWADLASVTDGTSTGGVSMAQTGFISFTSTVGTAKVKSIEQTLLYWYKFNVSIVDSATRIYHATLSIPFQDIVDIWDGVPHECISFLKYTSAGTYEDKTINVYAADYSSANTATYAQVGSLTAGYPLLVGFFDKMQGIDVTMVDSYLNSTASTILTVSYWDGSAWVSVGAISDGTFSGSSSSLAKTGTITWGQTTGEFKKEESKELPLYFYKLVFSSNLSSDVRIDKIAGIPAQKQINGKAFPIHAMNRVWLVSGNTISCSAEYTDNVFNGDDSLEFSIGDDLPIKAGTSISGQFGASLREILVLCKEHQTWILFKNEDAWERYQISKTIGCVAPLTMRTGHIGFEVAPGMNRHVAMWQGANGIYLFDGRTVHPVYDDIRDIFDSQSSTVIYSAMKNRSAGFFDLVNDEYHFLYADGASTSLNKELVYDIKRQRWYSVNRGSGNALQCGVEVADTNSNTYAYGALATGYLERLEYGNTFDGTAITQTMEFADIPLSGYENRSVFRKAILYTKAKATTTNNISVTHYADTKTTGSTALEIDPTSTSQRIVIGTKDFGNKATLHSLKFTMTTSDETIGFEPIHCVLQYEDGGSV